MKMNSDFHRVGWWLYIYVKRLDLSLRCCSKTHANLKKGPHIPSRDWLHRRKWPQTEQKLAAINIEQWGWIDGRAGGKWASKMIGYKYWPQEAAARVLVISPIMPQFRRACRLEEMGLKIDWLQILAARGGLTCLSDVTHTLIASFYWPA